MGGLNLVSKTGVLIIMLLTIGCSASSDDSASLIGTWVANGKQTIADPRNIGSMLTGEQLATMEDYFSTTILKFNDKQALKTNKGADESEHKWVGWKLVQSLAEKYVIEIVENNTPVQLTLLKIGNCIGLVSDEPYFIEHFCRESDALPEGV